MPMADDTDLNLDDLPDSGGSGGGRRSGGSGQRRGGRWIWLLVGVALGVAASLLVPRYVAPHLPAALGGGLVTVDGTVLDKERDGQRLLLTLDSERGAMLATFRERVPEIDLLVGQGDRVTLAMPEFRPFVDGPRLVGVRKGEWRGHVPPTPEAEGAADTVPPPARDTARSPGPSERRPGAAGGDAAPTPDTAPEGAPADTAGGGAGARTRLR